MSSRTDHPSCARTIMLGGFLGAGKTTVMLRLAAWLRSKGLRVGLISNDQGHHLVDTALYASGQFPVREVTGGCFCCRFDSLVEAAQHLTAAAAPEVFLAEPAGSCTDLVATVLRPLQQLHGDRFRLAPLSVMVDPVRAARVLGLEPGPRFSDKVLYLYRKQLEEADLLVINKVDQVDEARRFRLKNALVKEFARVPVIEVSARRGDNLEFWFDHLLHSERRPTAGLAVDYDVYAEGEARLGWLNGVIHLLSESSFDANALLERVARDLQIRLGAANAEIAHLKMVFDPRGPLAEVAAVHVVRNDLMAELSSQLPEPVAEGYLTVNLRAEAEPALLRRALEDAVSLTSELSDIVARWQQLEAFKPERPVPTHRVPNGGAAR